MYLRTVVNGNFTIESALAIFKDQIAGTIMYPKGIDTEKAIKYLILQYYFKTHKFIMIDSYHTLEDGKDVAEVETWEDDIQNNKERYPVAYWKLDRAFFANLTQTINMTEKIVLSVMNTGVSPNDTQINVLSKKEKDSMFTKIMEDIFNKAFDKEEDQNSALLELNYNPLVKPIVSDLIEKKISLPEAKEKLASMNFQQEQLAYMFDVLADNVTADQNNSSIADSNPDP